MATPLHLAYFYDLPLPSRFAAPIQILRTAHAMAELGASVTVFTGPIAAHHTERALAYYGLSPHPNLALRPFYPVADLRRALAEALGTWGGNGRRVVMSRGESGVRLAGALRGVLGPDDRFVYEAHRLCFDYVREQFRDKPWWAWPRCRARAARMRAAERRAVRQADGLVCLTEAVRDALVEHFGVAGRPTLILPSGTDCTVPLGRDMLDHDGRDIDVLYAGKFEDRKGVGQLIEAMARLPGVTFWLIGGDEAQHGRLLASARAHGIEDGRLRLTGYVEPGRIREYFLRARAGVCPLPAGRSPIAERFTSPMKVLEMMATGVPVVATDLPSVRVILTHGGTGLLVPPNDPAALADALHRLLTDRALARRLSASALTSVRSYAWPERAVKLRTFVEALA